MPDLGFVAMRFTENIYLSFPFGQLYFFFICLRSIQYATVFGFNPTTAWL
jgi:hypothetical protein